jgi:hypothetical protein
MSDHEELVAFLRTLTPDDRRLVMAACTKLGAHDKAAYAVMLALEEIDGPETVRQAPKDAY